MRQVIPMFVFVALAVVHADVHRAPAATPTTGVTDQWFSYVQFLASDEMAGRNTGSPEHKRAAEFVASEFRKAGLEPAGAGGYIQPVEFKTRRIVEARSSLALVVGGKTEPLTLGDDA